MQPEPGRWIKDMQDENFWLKNDKEKLEADNADLRQQLAAERQRAEKEEADLKSLVECECPKVVELYPKMDARGLIKITLRWLRDIKHALRLEKLLTEKLEVERDAYAIEARNYAEAIDNVRAALGLAGTHWMVIANDVEDVVKQLAATIDSLQATAQEHKRMEEALKEVLEIAEFYQLHLKRDHQCLHAEGLRSIPQKLEKARKALEANRVRPNT